MHISSASSKAVANGQNNQQHEKDQSQNSSRSKQKISDYIVEFFIAKNIEHIFGYPGGMVIHLMDSLSKYEQKIHTHICYHEQAAAFEACAYARAANTVGVAYATSGPGATNMITGICNAYFDSIPVIFITGQVNTFESKNKYPVRQRGFQETDIVELVRSVTKYAVRITRAEDIRYCLEKASYQAVTGRKGPVLLDIPMDIQRSEVFPEILNGYTDEIQNAESPELSEKCAWIEEALASSKRPCILIGAGAKGLPQRTIAKLAEHLEIPIVTSMIAVDLLPSDHPFNFGFIGAYGKRFSNFIVAKSDLVLVLGCRLDIRQVGAQRNQFAPNAQIVRVEIDPGELEYKIRDGDKNILANVESAVNHLLKSAKPKSAPHEDWLKVCNTMKHILETNDPQKCNTFVKKISEFIPCDSVITTDVGQNQVWTAQSFLVKTGQQILFSGGHGAMGFSLPAAIGAYYASRSPVISLNGDGGIQMNIQELQYISQERLPVKIVILNNYALGMIRHFQEIYLESNYMQTVLNRGYGTPDFEKLAGAYQIPYFSYENPDDVTGDFMQTDGPALVEIKLRENTYAYPKLRYGRPNQDAEPLLDRELYKYLMEL